MTTIPPLGREAIEHARRGDFDQAIAAARKALDADPHDLGLNMFLAMLHVRRMELGDALPRLRAALAAHPSDRLARSELARVLIALGELDEAETVLEQGDLPEPERLRLRAMLLDRRGDAAAAAALYRRLAEADPRDFESWGKLGLSLLATGETREAIAALRRSLDLRPDRLPIWHKWAEAHVLAGTGEQALAEVRGLADRGTATRLALAHLENLLGRPEQSLAVLEEAVRLDPSSADALVALAEMLERQNDLDGFEAQLERLAALPAKPDRLPLLQARLEYRRGNHDRALELARSAPPAADAGTRAQLIGQCLDKLGDPAGAYEAFVEMNRDDAASAVAERGTAEQYRRSIAGQRRLLEPEWIARWVAVDPPSQPQPAFLVGFPRSGTTLLDTLLMGHADVAVAEEKPMLAAVGASLGSFERLADLGAYEVEELRRLYFDVAKQHVPALGGRLLIDKYPFAMGSAPIVHRLFPAAPILFMERHPCDVVLSCFMTRFQPTQAATNFLALEHAALLYDEMMAMWTKSVELLPLSVHRARYERLTDDPEAELRAVAGFLGLDWDPRLLEHRETAKARAFIGTPSYAQVVEPVSPKAVGRWRRYARQMEPVLPILAPWAERMGYEI